MALYSYEAFSKDGKRVKGVIDVSSIAQVKEVLAKQGMFPISIVVTTQEARYGFFERLRMRSISQKEIIVFTNQLAVLLKSGVPLVQALELLIEQFEGRMRSLLVSVKDEVREGGLFADALKKYPQAFDTVYIQLIRAGEASGQLEVILEHLGAYMERNAATQKRIKKSLQEPMIQLIVSFAVVIFLLTSIVPQMAESFSSQGQVLPLPTRILLAISGFITGHYILLIGMIISLVVAYRYWASTASGARRIDTIKLNLPLIKYFTKTRAVVQFSYALGMLIEGGVNLAQALDIVCSIVDNKVLATTLQEAKDKIVKQGKITEYLKQTNIFPPIAIYLIKTGEETGKLGEMLLLVARNYEVELEDLTSNLTATIQPIMTVVMALIVGFIVMSVALPMMQMGKIIGS